MASLAIIPARGGSKRIPKKNIKLFLGMPIITYAIDAALKSNVFDEVMVSTDNEEIKNIAINKGAKVPFFRSDENSNDFSTLSDVLIEVLDEYKKQKKFFDTVCCILPTSALLSSEKITESYEKLIESDCKTIV